MAKTSSSGGVCFAHQQILKIVLNNKVTISNMPKIQIEKDVFYARSHPTGWKLVQIIILKNPHTLYLADAAFVQMPQG